MVRKRTISLLLACLLLVSFAAPAWAEFGTESALYIREAFSDIAHTAGGNIVVIGRTRTYEPVHSVSVSITLQRWNGSTWVDLNSWSNSNSNSNYAVVSQEINPAKGYYYRIRGTHEAENSGIREVMYSVTDYIFY